MNALIIQHLGDDDLCISIVDEERWNQVREIHTGWSGWGQPRQRLDQLSEVIGWLVSEDDDEVDRPKYAPDKVGRLIKTYYTQHWVIEEVEFDNVGRILTIP